LTCKKICFIAHDIERLTQINDRRHRIIFKKFGDNHILRVDRGEKILSTIKLFCAEYRIRLGSITAIGATDRATVGRFNTKTKKYRSMELTEDLESTGITCNISTMNGEVYIHPHATLSDSQLDVFGGHLNSAVVSGT
jgi:predicted DNA-binding protein with PD1-like motif